MSANISRRWFIGGLASFGAFGGNRIFRAHAGTFSGGKPNLTFGVVSDVHVRLAASREGFDKGHDTSTFIHTLEWFRAQGVDAVMIVGDIADKGLVDELKYVADAWFKVFPNDKAPDERHVQRLFVYGNHDYEGFGYGGYAKKLWPDETERAQHVLRADQKANWEKIFNEPFAPIMNWEVNGYTFVGGQWTADKCRGKEETGIAGVEEYFAAHRNLLDPKKPFFYFQHPHPKDTCYGNWAWGHDDGRATRALSAFPNAIAFSGHSHTTLTHDQSIWQGAFTSLGTSSLRYTGGAYALVRHPMGYENGGGTAAFDPYKIMPGYGSTRDGRQGMLVRVYDSHVAFTRREFVYDQSLGDDWVLPLPAAESKPFAFAEHAKRSIAPEFPAGAELLVSRARGKNRGAAAKGKAPAVPAEEKAVFVLDFPAATASKGRVFDYEIVAAPKDGGKKVRKFLMADGYNMSIDNPRARRPQTCRIAADQLPQGVEFCFAVRPVNSLGKPGRPIVSTWQPAIPKTQSV